MRKMITMKILFLTLALGSVLSAADAPRTFTGVITDTLCGAGHAMMKAKSDASCVKLCVKGSGEYALFDGQSVLKLTDQKTPARFVAQHVKVVGTYDQKSKTIKVSSIEPVSQ